jgi:hypothetical protein
MEIIHLAKPQNVCTIKDDKGKICSGHLKTYLTAPANLRQQLTAAEELYRCKRCAAVYRSPLQRHLQPATTPITLPPQVN